MLHLIPTILTHTLARVYEWGINNKYRRDSWKEFTPEQAREDLTPAAMRHIDCFRDGEWLDPQTKLPHLILAIWNLTTLLWHCSREKKEIHAPESYFDAPPPQDIINKLKAQHI